MTISSASLSILALGRPLPTGSAGPSADEEAETTVEVVCGKSEQLCEALYEWTDNEFVAEATSFLLGTPTKVVLILVIALILNRIARRVISRSAKRLRTATAEHGEASGSVRESDVASSAICGAV